jgi:K+-sensing histidine kinase KdpD
VSNASAILTGDTTRKEDHPDVTAGRARLAAYAFAIVGPMVVVVLKLRLNAAIDGDVGFAASWAVVIVAALLGGFGPGLLATAIAAVLEAVVFMDPVGAASLASGSDQARLGLFILDGVLLSWLASWTREGRRLATAARDDLHRERTSAEAAVARLTELQAVTAALSRARTSAEVAAAVLDAGRRMVGASAGAVYVLDPSGANLRLLDAVGYEPVDLDRWRVMPMDTPAPAAEAVRTGTAIFAAAADGYRARFPHTRDTGGAPATALAILPLEIAGLAGGAIGLTWSSPVGSDRETRDALATLAALTGQALERARLFEAEREARALAESQRRRAFVLSEAGRALGMSLESSSTIEAVARLALPVLGDHCVVDVLTGPAPSRFVAVLDPAEQGDAQVVQARPVDLATDNPIAKVIATRRPIRIDVTPELLDRVALDPEHRAALGRFRLARALIVPLLTHEEVVGSLLVGSRDPTRAYGEEDLATAEALAQRAARAIENVRLHLEVRRLLERERDHAAELESVIAAIGEGIVVLDGDGSVRTVNDAAVRILGGSVSDETALAARLGTARSLRVTGDEIVGPAEHRLLDAPARWVELTAYPVRTDAVGPIATVCVIRDVTAFRQGQGLREAFLSLLSHELRTPVTTIYGGATVLARPEGALPENLRREILADVGAEADRLYRLVEDLLVLARFDEGLALGDEPNLLQRIAPRVIEQEQVRWPNVTFRVEVVPDLPTVRGDETAIQQVVRNLCSNAAKYSPAGSTVEVRVEAVGEQVGVRVLDKGAGIRIEEVEHLFDPFYRSPATEAMAGGAGIGLYVCRRLIDAMGGAIWGLRRAEGGSEFGISLPRYELLGEDEPSAAPQAAPAVDAAGLDAPTDAAPARG